MGKETEDRGCGERGKDAHCSLLTAQLHTNLLNQNRDELASGLNKSPSCKFSSLSLSLSLCLHVDKS